MKDFCCVRYDDIIIFAYHEDTKNVKELLMNPYKHKTAAIFVEYCYMIGCTVMLEYVGVKKSSKMTRIMNLVKKYDIGMTEEQTALFQKEVEQMMQ